MFIVEFSVQAAQLLTYAFVVLCVGISVCNAVIVAAGLIVDGWLDTAALRDSALALVLPLCLLV